MRKSLVTNACLLMLLAPALAACEPERHVENNGVSYYDANDVSTDTLPSQPYTKGGQYVINPDEATNTRDNRGMRPQGYGHNTDDDWRNVQHVNYPAGTVVYGDGTVVYPNGAVVYPDGRTTTTTRTTTVIETTEPGY